jgi:hypothetical protein
MQEERLREGCHFRVESRVSSCIMGCKTVSGHREREREMSVVGGGSNEFKPHQVKEQLPGVDFSISSSPVWRNSLSFSVFAFLPCSVFCLLLSTSLLATLLSYYSSFLYDLLSLSHSPFHHSWLFGFCTPFSFLVSVLFDSREN